MLRRSAPPSSRCVAKLWRARAGRIRRRHPARSVHFLSLRLTSLVPRGRPLFDRNRASSVTEATSAGRARSQYAPRLRAPARRRAEARLAPLALDPQLLGVVFHVARLQRDELLGSQPARVGELEHRAIAQLERAAGGDAVQQLGRLACAQHARQMRGAPRRRDQVGRILGYPPVLALAREQRPQRCELACGRRRRGSPLGQMGDVAAHGLRADDLLRGRGSEPRPNERTARGRCRTPAGSARRRRGESGPRRAARGAALPGGLHRSSVRRHRPGCPASDARSRRAAQRAIAPSAALPTSLAYFWIATSTCASVAGAGV